MAYDKEKKNKTVERMLSKSKTPAKSDQGSDNGNGSGHVRPPFPGLPYRPGEA